MLASMRIQLASGLIGETRKIKGTELLMLAESADDAGGASIEPALGACWVRTIDPGPYGQWLSPGPGPLAWDRILKGDLMDGLLRLRADSLPNGWFYEFPVQCHRCKARYDWRVDIIRDLARKTLPKTSFDAVASGSKLCRTTLTMDDGAKREVTFQLMSSKDDGPILDLLKRQKRTRPTLVDSIAMQTRSIEGANTDLPHLHRVLSDLDLGQLQGLRNDYDAADCGVNTAILTTCTTKSCQWKQEVALPFGGTFFAPMRPGNTIPDGYVRPMDPDEAERLDREANGTTSTSSGQVRASSGQSSADGGSTSAAGATSTPNGGPTSPSSSDGSSTEAAA